MRLNEYLYEALQTNGFLTKNIRGAVASAASEQLKTEVSHGIMPFFLLERVRDKPPLGLFEPPNYVDPLYIPHRFPQHLIDQIDCTKMTRNTQEDCWQHPFIPGMENEQWYNDICDGCGNRNRECECCPDCGMAPCECPRCYDCGRLLDECSCPKCPGCGEKECECARCPDCGKREIFCECEDLPTSGDGPYDGPDFA